MPAMMQPEVAVSQQLQRAAAAPIMQPMVAPAPESHALAFSQRLAQALSDAGIPDDRYRRGWVSKTFGVSVESARKWLTGEALPQPHRIAEIANTLLVSASWLQYGEDVGRIAEPGHTYDALELTPRERTLILNYRAADEALRQVVDAAAATAAGATGSAQSKPRKRA